MDEEQNRFSLRKLSVGLASVLVGVSIFGTSQIVKADTVMDQAASAVTSNAQSGNIQKNKNTIKSSFSNENQANNVKSNLTQTQGSDQNTQKQDRAKNVQQDSVPKTQEATDSNDLQEKYAENGIVRTISLQKVDNQFNPANNQAVDVKEIAESKVEKTYNADINAWTGHDDGTYYVLDKYTPQNNAEKDLIVIPNEADFEKVGKSTNGHEVSLDAIVLKSAVKAYNPKEVHFSETNNKKIKARNADWNTAFNSRVLNNRSNLNNRLEAITGNSLDTSDIQVMYEMFEYCSDLKDISALKSWNVSNVSNLGHAFNGAQSLTNIDALRNWNTSKVLYWDNMFRDCPNLTNIDVINNWNYSSASTSAYFGKYPLDDMFYGDHKIQINIGTNSGLADFIRRTGRIDAFHNSSNQISTSNTKLIECLTNTDFKSQAETTTAKRTITFSDVPDSKTIPPIVQIINYTKLATAIIDMTNTSDSNAYGKIVSLDFDKDWKLDTSKQNDAIIVNGQIHFKAVKIPHINGYKAYLVRNKLNPALFTVSFMAIPSESKPLAPVEETSSKPSAPTVNSSNSGNSAWNNLDHKIVDTLNQSNSGWTILVDKSTHKADASVNAVAIAQPIHAQTRVQTRANKHFKLRKHGKKHVVKHLKHRKKVTKHGKQHIAKHFKYRKKAAKHDNKHAVKHFKHRKKVASRFKKHRL